MSALKKLVNDCKAMDIQNQINTFDDSFLPSNAAAELAAIRAENARLREALIEIEKGEGAYSTDQLTHACNTIENMQSIAREALKTRTAGESR